MFRAASFDYSSLVWLTAVCFDYFNKKPINIYRHVARRRPRSIDFNIIRVSMREALANNKDADQPAHPRRLINAFIIHYLKSKVTRSDISQFFNFVLMAFNMIKPLATPLILHILLYDWRESCLLIGLICLHKSLCLPGNWSAPVHKLILHGNQLELVSRS